MSQMERGWCSRPECPCWRPTTVCEEWMGYDDGECEYEPNDIETWPIRYCPRCGWEKHDHKGEQ